MTNTPSNQVAAFPNADLGIAATVITVPKGFAVTLIDTDASQVVGRYTYPAAMLEQAIAKAKQLANV